MTENGINIQRVGRKDIEVPIVGKTPLLMHKFSEKSKRQMLDAMQGRKSPKTAKDPEQEFLDATYRMDDGGFGFPAIGFKAATVSAARFFGSDVTMVGLRQQLFFGGEMSKAEGQMMVRIEGEPEMREDVVRVGRGGTDLRYRPIFPEWKATLHITYVESMLTKDSVLSLLDAAGMGVGIGEWRPEKSGDFGQFEIDGTRDVVVTE